jgi:hypothetical protein
MPLHHVLLAATLCAASVQAAAATWLCGLSEEATRLICVADADLHAVPAAAGVTAAVRGTAFPLDPARVWTVDLWSPPTEAGFVAQLAQATICYRSPDCRVVMARLPMTGSETVAAR